MEDGVCSGLKELEGHTSASRADMRPLPFPVRPVARADYRTVLAGGPGYEGVEPVVLTGFLEDWDFYRQLHARTSVEAKVEYLREMIHRDDCLYYLADRTRHYSDGALQSKSVTLNRGSGAAFCDRALERHRNPSLGSVYLKGRFLDAFPNVARGVAMDRLLCRSAGTMLWIGMGGQVYPLHAEPYANFLCMVDGVKRITVLPLEALPDLYPTPWDAGLAGGSFPGASYARFVDQLNLTRFPKVARALESARVAEIGPGDVLYLPTLWWHHVESFGFNVMINNWDWGSLEDSAYRAVLDDLVEAMALFRRMPDEERTRHGELYRRLWEGAPVALPTDRRAARHFARVQDAWQRLPAPWRAALPACYDYFVFKKHGEPYPDDPWAVTRTIWLHRVRRALASLSRFRAQSKSIGNVRNAVVTDR